MRGMVLGKFLPPHRGHQYLIDFACSYCSDLTVLVCSIERESIPGGLRFEWMQEQFPQVNVVHIDEELPQEPSEHEDFWAIWRRVVLDAMGAPDLVFASEPYGLRLAAELGAEFVPVDIARELVPVSGSAIRQDPRAHWDYLIEPARPYFLKRIAIVGPESSGKSTLARELARRFQTRWVHEFARPYLEHRGPGPALDLAPEDFPKILRGHQAAQSAMGRQASRLLFVDTDALTTSYWSQHFGLSMPEIVFAAERERFDLTLLLRPDLPFEEDEQRTGHDRERCFEWFEDALKRLERPYVVIEGFGEERLVCAAQHVEECVNVQIDREASSGC